MRIKTITDPKPLKKYKAKRKRPEDAVIVLFKPKGRNNSIKRGFYNGMAEFFSVIYEEGYTPTNFNDLYDISDVDYWYIEICGKGYHKP
jgi:uncharacterized protein YneR